MTIADVYERHMLDLINAERAAVGAPPLQLEQNLNLSADRHSAWMLQADVFSHTGQGGSSATDRMRDADFDFSGSWRSAENIAVQSERGPDGIMDDVENLHTSLMNSPGHRANILNPDLDYIGIGIALGDFDFSSGTYESVIVTQNFASTGGQVDLDLGEIAPAPVVAEKAPVALFQAQAAAVAADLVAEEPVASTPVAPTVTQTPEPEDDPVPTVTVEPVETPASPWAAIFDADTVAFLDGLFDDLGDDVVFVEQGPTQPLSTTFHDMVRHQFDQLEDTFASLQTDDIAF